MTSCPRSVDDDTASSNNDPAVPVCHATEESAASISVTLPCVLLMLTSVSNLTSVDSHATEPDPQLNIPLKDPSQPLPFSMTSKLLI